jgi:outer membrane protein TolC
MKHKQKLVWLVVVAMVFHFTTSAQQETTKTLNLKEAIDLGIKNSKLLKNNAAKIAEATAAIKEAKDNRLPDVGFSGSYYVLPTTPSYSLKIKTGNDSSKTTSTPSVHQAWLGMMSASLPLYQGGRIRYGIESAQYLEKATKLDADNNRQGVIINIIDAFANLYKSKAAVSLVQENLDQARQRVTDFTNLEKNGLLARNDLLKAELTASNNELALLDAESNYKLAYINMDIMLGLPENTLLVPDSASLQQNGDLKNIQDYEQLAFQNRKDIEALSYRKKAAETGVKSVKAETMPSVGLSAGYIATDVPNLLYAYNITNIGVGVKYNLSSLWKNDSKVQQAKARQQEVETQDEILRDEISIAINRDYQNYLVSKKKIDVYAKAVDQATENYKVTKNKYDNTLATTTDLLDADVAQLQAKLNFAFAKTDAIVAYDKLLQDAGLLEGNSK